MSRRQFLLQAGAGLSVLAGSAGAAWKWLEMPATIYAPGRSEGHFLRNLLRQAQQGVPLPQPALRASCQTLILGSGVAALTAAWKLRKKGRTDVLMLDGPQLHGNAAGGAFGAYHYPRGGHYLPLPSPESAHVREILFDLGIIKRDPYAEAPLYDESCVLHAPEERLLRNGYWQDGFLPTEETPQWELDEHKRFFAEVERLRALHGRDGRRVFVFPTELSSTDPEWMALDKLSLKAWMEQQGYRAPTLHWYLDYCCRDDYGRSHDQISAWAGLHYYCSRWGKAANANHGAWLTWPDGLSHLARGMDRLGGARHMQGSAYRLQLRAGGGVEAHCLRLGADGQPEFFALQAQNAICAMPLYLAARIIPHIRELGFEPQRDTPRYAPWLVANFLLRRFPEEKPHVPLSWDNVVYSAPGLGYVVSTHQQIRQTPPPKTVFTSYVAMSHMEIDAARKWLDRASKEELLELAMRDLHAAYGWRFAACVEQVELTIRGHAMAAPVPGFRNNPGVQALRQARGPILFAHADLSGFSVFEEAAWWGLRAAELL
ncbi:NAD(P)-binding protein [Massilia sp. W12]|uniref:NAD(P)-binding protein n=1 Tax=Massilia sp. W12 TaxID=3126507 RepID=UPI0030D250AF